MRTQGEDSHLQAEESGLRRNQSCWNPYVCLLACRSETINACRWAPAPTSMWCFFFCKSWQTSTSFLPCTAWCQGGWKRDRQSISPSAPSPGAHISPLLGERWGGWQWSEIKITYEMGTGKWIPLKMTRKLLKDVEKRFSKYSRKPWKNSFHWKNHINTLHDLRLKNKP